MTVKTDLKIEGALNMFCDFFKKKVGFQPDTISIDFSP
jgi:hypothetical protein